MDALYLEYCPASQPFYDRPRAGAASSCSSHTALSCQPAGRRRADAEWVYYTPAGSTPRPQGWKVHVSATPDTAERVLAETAAYCLGAGVPFKALRDRDALVQRSSKYADRGASGKFVTVYPTRRRRLRDPRAGPARAGRRAARAVHPVGPALGRRPGVRTVRRLRLPAEDRTGRADHRVHRGPGRQPRRGRAAPRLPPAALGTGARLPSAGPAGARRTAAARLPLPGRRPRCTSPTGAASTGPSGCATAPRSCSRRPVRTADSTGRPATPYTASTVNTPPCARWPACPAYPPWTPTSTASSTPSSGASSSTGARCTTSSRSATR